MKTLRAKKMQIAAAEEQEALAEERAIRDRVAELEKSAAPREQLQAQAIAAAKARDSFAQDAEKARLAADVRLAELMAAAVDADARSAAAATAFREAQVLKFEYPEVFGLEEITNLDACSPRNICGDTINFRDPKAPEIFVTGDVFLREQLSRHKRMDAARLRAQQEHEAAMQEWNDRNKFVSFLLRTKPPIMREVAWTDLVRE